MPDEQMVDVALIEIEMTHFLRKDINPEKLSEKRKMAAGAPVDCCWPIRRAAMLSLAYSYSYRDQADREHRPRCGPMQK